MPRKLKGIRRHRNAWQVHVRIQGRQYTKTFALATPLSEMRAWRAAQIETLSGEVPAAESLEADVVRYLARRQSMVSITQRAAHLALWLQELGRSRSRQSVTADEIEIVLESWRDTLAPGTIKKRRTALQSFYVAMNGKRGANPVRGTTIPREPKPEARHLDRAVIERVLAAMPQQRSTKPGAVASPSLAPIRAAVLAATGIPPGLLKQVQPHDLSLHESGSLRVRARRKGGGVEARTLSLTPDGLEAFKAFHAANAYGRFATQALNRAFKRACRSIGLDPKAVHLYDLRHSFLTDLYRVTRDLATVARMGLHAEGSRITARYAQGANDEVDRAAVAALGTAWSEGRQALLKTVPPVHKTAKKVATKGDRAGKLRVIK